MRDIPGLHAVQIQELVLQGLETELGGVKVYETALRCVEDGDLRSEWQDYLTQTKRHVEVVQDLCRDLGIDAGMETPGRAIVRAQGEAFVEAMQAALAKSDAKGAELVAAECVVHAETKDHLNWSLMGVLAKNCEGDVAEAFKRAFDEVEDEEDEHLYHTMGWTRELWLKSLGIPAAIPPPEERKDVRSMAGAARAKAQRRLYARKRG